MNAGEALGREWRAARLPAQGLHLDSAACSRQSLSAIEAADRHARLESVIGGYVAAQRAAAELDSGRAAVAALTGMSASDVMFTTGSGAARDALLRAWPAARTVACLPGEYGPNLAAFAAHGFSRRELPADRLGRVDPASAAVGLRDDPPAMVHLTAVGSHRGVAQPVSEIAALCRDIGVPLVVDAAQALGHIDCAVGAEVVYASSRKWLAGPRGVGVLAVRPQLAATMPALAGIELGEANVAARVGFSVAVGEYLAAGPESVRHSLAALGGITRAVLADVAGWRVVEPEHEPTAITTVEPTGGADPVAVRARLLAEHGIVTTAAGVERAPRELTGPVLRISPHVDSTPDDIEAFAAALRAITR